jgi:hypothetical protein
VLLDRGLKVALVTDGRMSGASGKVPSAIHVAPEAAATARFAAAGTATSSASMPTAGTLEVLTDLADRPAATPDLAGNGHGVGRELFEIFRDRVWTPPMAPGWWSDAGGSSSLSKYARRRQRRQALCRPGGPDADPTEQARIARRSPPLPRSSRSSW